MTPSLGDSAGADLEHSCGPDEWVDATRPADGVELFRARLRGRPFSRHRHDVYAIGVTEERVEAGFADEAHFTRTFKAAFGMTPGRYTRLCTAYSQLRPNAMPVRLQLLR